ncbi:MAG: hypothetical protein KY441_08000 [Actinobacteria bacterium]|nr:hypothetical protein [Actinomycetota bacterium]
MQFVDFDEYAARQAGEVCRSAAQALDAAASRLTSAADGRLGHWSGASRIGFDANADDIARALRREAGDLEATAEAISRALAEAEALDDTRRQAHLEAEREHQRLERLGGVA